MGAALVGLALNACGDGPAPTPIPTNTPAQTATGAAETVRTDMSTPTPTSAPASTPVQTSDPEQAPVQSKRGFSDDSGALSPYVEPAEIDGSGRKLLAIYMVGSDLEEDDLAGTNDFGELIEGYESLPDSREVEVVAAFGGANKDGWRGMKIANISQLIADAEDQDFGNETGSDAYLYRADGAHMGDETSLKLFLDYLKDGYVNFDLKFLAFWDHGNSYKGFGNDTNFNGDELSMDEIERAFRRSQPGIFDLIGFDACLMASLEVAKVFEDKARYMIASEETEPGHGWLWSAVVQSYAEEDSISAAGRRMVDTYVRNVHEEDEWGKTLSLLDLSEYDGLVAALNPVVSAFGGRLLSSDEYSSSLVNGTQRAESYGKSARERTRSSIDLMHFARLLAESAPSAEVGQSLNELMEAVDRFVVHSNHDGARPNSFGVAIDAPENTEPEYSAYKVSDTWLDFQSAYYDLRQSDTSPPSVVSSVADVDPQSLQLDPEISEQFEVGVLVTFEDEYLAKVSTLYGFVERIAFEDYFTVVAELEAYPTEDAGEYFAPAWDQWWFTVEYDTAERTAWIPASFESRFEVGGREYTTYTAEIDYQPAGADAAEPAVMALIVNQNMEIVDYYIQTYQYVYSGPDDDEGTLQFDKATYEIVPGDAVQFWSFSFNLEDPSKDEWFEASEVITFEQEPVFQLEFLEFIDEFGQPIEYQYATWAEDVSGNGVVYGPFEIQ